MSRKWAHRNMNWVARQQIGRIEHKWRRIVRTELGTDILTRKWQLYSLYNCNFILLRSGECQVWSFGFWQLRVLTTYRLQRSIAEISWIQWFRYFAKCINSEFVYNKNPLNEFDYYSNSSILTSSFFFRLFLHLLLLDYIFFYSCYVDRFFSRTFIFKEPSSFFNNGWQQ